MKTILIPLIGDPKENLYQLGLKEKEAFLRLETRITRLLSSNSFLRYGQDIISRARAMMKKREEPGFFEECIAAYAEGLGIESTRYFSFLSLLELAAHYGQVYPELKSILPGCTSVFHKGPEGISHSRLIDFPLLGIFDEAPRLYYWKFEGKPSVLNYSCEGLAPLFFQSIHESGFSLALHHKPGESYHKNGDGIFKITFEAMFSVTNFEDFRKDVRKKNSITKWGFLILNKDGQVQAIDIDGPAMNFETYHLNETSPIIFTNIPLHRDPKGFESFISFCQHRQNWLKDKLQRSPQMPVLDAMTDVEDQKARKWLHPAATLSTVGAFQINLSRGIIDVKEGESPLVASDVTVRFSLSDQSKVEVVRPAALCSDFERAWKRAGQAQRYFDEGEWDLAYHHLQMALAIMPHLIWKEIITFYLCLWDFRFVSNPRELAQIYKKLKTLRPPEQLKDQYLLLCMRIEKKLQLSPTVTTHDVSPYLQELFQQEKLASKVAFNAWMKLLYPRIELLDVFSPHH